LNDSLIGRDKIEALTFAEARWNAEKKQHEIERLQSKQNLNQETIKRKEAETRRQKMFIYFIIAIFLLSVLSGIVIALYFRKRRDAVFQKQLANITKLRMQNARNIMSPHFFFNTLSSFSGLSDQHEIFKDRLNNLSLLLRKAIENIDQTAIPLDEELSAVKAYIDLQRVNIPEPFKVVYQIAEGTNLRRLVPAMIMQIPVENAIKHGLMPLDGEKLLQISIVDSEECQNIVVEDNGIGVKASVGRSVGTGTGLKVLLQTIHLLNSNNKQKIQFSIEERKIDNGIVSGTSVTIIVPFDFNFVL
jgi:LytS/YehU family sensor histidine kinase